MKTAVKKVQVATTATEGLRILWAESVFSVWRKKGPLVDALAKKGNHFSDAELGMALLRARFLTRKGKPGNYEYVQKYPYAPEPVESAVEKKGTKQ
jgi:hypothetical protein